MEHYFLALIIVVFVWLLKKRRIKNLIMTVNSLEKLIASNQAKLEFINQEKFNLLTKIQELENILKKVSEENIRIKVEYDSHQLRFIEQKNDFHNIKQMLEGHFKNLANDIFDEKTRSFKDFSKEQISNILNPLNKEIRDFRERMEKTYEKENIERISLKSEIEKIVKCNEALSKEAVNLTNALKGDVKMQGKWGEFILEKILEGSGLRKGIEFTCQGEGMGLKNEFGHHLHPDYIINLPDEKHLVLDSKVSLIHYDKYLSATEKNEQEKYLRLLDLSIQDHLKGLSEKDYNFNEKIMSPDFTLMFMPVEAAFSLVMGFNQNLFQNAWQKNIVIVGPTTLMATLRTIASVWRIEKQNRNHLEIAKLGGSLYDKLVLFMEDLSKINLSLITLEKSFDAIFKKITTGRGNMISIAEMLRELGAKTTKKFSGNIGEKEVQG